MLLSQVRVELGTAEVVLCSLKPPISPSLALDFEWSLVSYSGLRSSWRSIVGRNSNWNLFVWAKLGKHLCNQYKLEAQNSKNQFICSCKWQIYFISFFLLLLWNVFGLIQSIIEKAFTSVSKGFFLSPWIQYVGLIQANSSPKLGQLKTSGCSKNKMFQVRK